MEGIGVKILFDGIIYEIQKAGGISKYWCKLTNYFSLDDNVEVVSIQGINAEANIFFPKKIKNKIYNQDWLPLKIRRYLPVFNTYNCEIFHSSYYRVPFFKSKHTKQIVTVHDFMYEFFDTGLKKKVHIWQKRKAMLNADAIICVSEHTKQDLIKLYPEVKREILYVVPNGVDEEFKVLAKSNEKKDFLLFVGNRMGCKNFKFILKFMTESKFIQDKQFYVKCVGGGKFNKHEFDLFKEFGVAGKIKQVLSIENEELNVLYNQAYALLFPSKYEGFGIPALEAQMAGCPVVYAKTSSLPEVMGYDELGYTLDDLTEADQKLQLLEDDIFRKNIIVKGVNFVSKLTCENSAKLTYKVYKKALNNE